MEKAKLKELVREFTNGFIAGSCNSFDQSVDVLVAEYPNIDPAELEKLLTEVIKEEEIFLCEVCGWWCWAHELSYNNIDTCTECSGEE